MARQTLHIDKHLLTSAIEAAKNVSLSNPTALNQFIAKYLQKHGITISHPTIGKRIAEYGIATPFSHSPIREEESLKKTKSTLDLTPFTSRGIVVTSLSDLLTSPLKDDETNLAIMAAIVAVRKEAGLPALSLKQFERLKNEHSDSDARDSSGSERDLPGRSEVELSDSGTNPQRRLSGVR